MFAKIIKFIFPPYPLPITAATAIIINNKNQYLLVKRSKTSKLYKHFWQLPEGKIKPGENPKQTLIRELEEELHFNPKTLFFVAKNIYIKTYFGFPLVKITRHIYRTSNFPKKIKLSHEHEDYVWANQSKLNNMSKLLPGVREIIEEVSKK